VAWAASTARAKVRLRPWAEKEEVVRWWAMGFRIARRGGGLFSSVVWILVDWRFDGMARVDR